MVSQPKIEGEPIAAPPLSVPDLETAYQNLRPMLFGALGKLSHQGFSVLPSDGLDLIHDFFLEEWHKVCFHYNPGKGRFGTYVYAAFVNFARPRLIRLQRLQQSLADPQELTKMAQEQVPDTDVASSGEFQAFDRLVARLPDDDRELLLAYVHSGRSPERALARGRGLSRYHLREQLIAALGRLAVLLEQPTGIPDRDWQVAMALWRDEHSIQEAAWALGLTEAQVRNAQKRNTQYLTEALSQYQASQKTTKKRN